ncbi:hypothetical protein ACQP3D_28790, partial [Escherichia coli]
NENTEEFRAEKALLRVQWNRPTSCCNCPDTKNCHMEEKEHFVWHRVKRNRNSVALLCFFFSSIQLLRDRGYTVPEEEEK